jgi:hypothetical protein
MSAIDKAKNKAQESRGRLKEAAGKATHDSSLEAKGKADRVSEPSWVSWRLHTLEARMETCQTHRSGTRVS